MHVNYLVHSPLARFVHLRLSPFPNQQFCCNPAMLANRRKGTLFLDLSFTEPLHLYLAVRKYAFLIGWY